MTMEETEREVLLNEMSSGVNMVMTGVHGRLFFRYKDQYGEEDGGMLATVITNVLFSKKPSNADETEYLNSNKTLILEELKKLQSDRELCDMVTQSARVNATVALERNTEDRDLLTNHFRKLTDLGLFVPGAAVPTPGTFLPKANEFLQSTDAANEKYSKAK